MYDIEPDPPRPAATPTRGRKAGGLLRGDAPEKFKAPQINAGAMVHSRASFARADHFWRRPNQDPNKAGTGAAARVRFPKLRPDGVGSETMHQYRLFCLSDYGGTNRKGAETAFQAANEFRPKWVDGEGFFLAGAS